MDSPETQALEHAQSLHPLPQAWALTPSASELQHTPQPLQLAPLAFEAMVPVEESKAAPLPTRAESERPPNSVPKSPSLGPVRDSVIHLRGTTSKLVLGMVGLPARGKTYIARKLARYLQWVGYSCKVFNIGNYRRTMVGAEKSSDFFDPSNEEAVKERRQCAISALDAMVKFLQSGGHAAIYDGTNSTKYRRALVEKYLTDNATGLRTKVIWIESICDIPDVITRNIRLTKVLSPDYQNMSTEEAVEDFCRRIKQYEKAYETVGGENTSYVKLLNIGRQVIVNNCRGYLPTRLVFFLMNLNYYKQVIYLTRHGQSMNNQTAIIGGDPPLSSKGQRYSMALAKFLSEQEEIQRSQRAPLQVWSSTLKRTTETAAPILKVLRCEHVEWRSLDEIDAGICDGLTYKQIEEKYPKEFKARKVDKLNYRYPKGESYRDLTNRLENVIFELERVRGPIVVVAHQAVLRCLYAYFFDVDKDKIPHLAIPLHTVVKLQPQAYGLQETRIPLVPLSPKSAKAGSSGYDFGDKLTARSLNLASAASAPRRALTHPTRGNRPGRPQSTSGSSD